MSTYKTYYCFVLCEINILAKPEVHTVAMSYRRYPELLTLFMQALAIRAASWVRY